ncbi:MAG: chitobiase/beta-hexosaminidase C-terminal domain-containing protein [Eubacteriales bacterium]
MQTAHRQHREERRCDSAEFRRIRRGYFLYHRRIHSHQKQRFGQPGDDQGTPGENITIKAIAVASGTDRAVSAATFTYTIMNRLAAPTSSVPTGAVFTKKSAIQLTAETGSIYYTTDGTQPSTASSV